MADLVWHQSGSALSAADLPLALRKIAQVIGVHSSTAQNFWLTELPTEHGRR